MKLTLERLHLERFKGALDTSIEPAGRDITIYGDNATGKTTLHDAWTWLLFGKDASGIEGFSIKTVEDGQPMSGVEHSVTATLRVDDEPLELRKVYSEKWVKRRGASERELAGHETRHYVDGVPVPKRAYDEAVDRIAPAAWFRVLSDPLAFSTMNWRDRREILVSAFGNVTDQDLASAHPELQPLLAAAGKRSIEDHRKVLDESRKRLNRDRAALPARIDEATRAIAGAIDLDAAKAEVAEAQRVVREARAALEAKRAANPRAEIDAERLLVERDLERAITEAKRQRDDARHELDRALRHALQAEQDADRARERAAKRADDAEAERDVARAAVEELRGRYATARAETFAPPTEPDRCPTCHQILPEHQVEEALAEAHRAWRAAKATELERIKAAGSKAAERLEAATAAATRTETEALTAAGEHERASEARALAQQAINAHDETPAEEAPEVTRLRNRARLLAAQAAAEDAPLDDAAELAAANAADEAHDAARAKLGEAQAAERARGRVAELRDEEKRMAAELTEVESQIDLCDRYTRYRVAALEEAINTRFRLARFRLFEDQINGGIAEVCETTYAGVPWHSLNHGTRVNVGIDIIDTLAAHHGFTPPVWIDNAESITTIHPSLGQQVRLVVSRDDPELRAETETTA